MQNIHVSRYSNPESVGYQGTVEPEDRSWIVFVKLDGSPSLWRRTESELGDGKTDGRYVNVALDSRHPSLAP